MEQNFALQLFMRNMMEGGGGNYGGGGMIGSGNGLMGTPISTHLKDIELVSSMPNKIQPNFGLTFFKLIAGLQSGGGLGLESLFQSVQPNTLGYLTNSPIPAGLFKPSQSKG